MKLSWSVERQFCLFYLSTTSLILLLFSLVFPELTMNLMKGTHFACGCTSVGIILQYNEYLYYKCNKSKVYYNKQAFCCNLPSEEHLEQQESRYLTGEKYKTRLQPAARRINATST